jgi:hypothetical protein
LQHLHKNFSSFFKRYWLPFYDQIALPNMLQFHTIYNALTTFADRLMVRAQQEQHALALFFDVFRLQSSLCSRYDDAQIAHTVAAIPVEEPTFKQSVPMRPSALTLCATDGSQIFPDRHLNADFFLLNTSHIIFHIGTTEKPTLQSHAQLYDIAQLEHEFQLEEDEEPQVSSEVVTALRQEEELPTLLHAARSAEQDALPLLALADGTLICWHLKRIKTLSLQHSFVARYAGLLAQFRQHRLTLASYISRPSSKEVVNLLQVLLRPELDAAQINLPNTLNDAAFFANFLSAGERSAIFGSRSEMLAHYDTADRIYFFYLHTGQEIARIEFPSWCYDSGKVDFIHATIFDDLKKGGGYPMTLTEAHEQATIKPSDQEEFYRLLQQICSTKGYALNYSAKSLSKRISKL